MKCKGSRKCTGSAVGYFSWGPCSNPDENKDIPLCNSHLDNLWHEIKRAVGKGEIIYNAKSIPEELK